MMSALTPKSQYVFPVTREDVSANVQSEIQEYKKTIIKAALIISGLLVLGLAVLISHASVSELAKRSICLISLTTVAYVIAMAVMVCSYRRVQRHAELAASEYPILPAVLDDLLQNGFVRNSKANVIPANSIQEAIRTQDLSKRQGLVAKCFDKTMWDMLCKNFEVIPILSSMSNESLIAFFKNHLGRANGLAFGDIIKIFENSALAAKKEVVLNALRSSEEFLSKTLLSMSNEALVEFFKDHLNRVPHGLTFRRINEILERPALMTKKDFIMNALESSEEFLKNQTIENGIMNRPMFHSLINQRRYSPEILKKMMPFYLSASEKVIDRANIAIQAQFHITFWRLFEHESMEKEYNYPMKWAKWCVESKDQKVKGFEQSILERDSSYETKIIKFLQIPSGKCQEDFKRHLGIQLQLLKLRKK